MSEINEKLVLDEVMGRTLALRATSSRLVSSVPMDPYGTDESQEIDLEALGDPQTWLIVKSCRQLMNQTKAALKGERPTGPLNLSDAFFDLEALIYQSSEELACNEFVYEALPENLRPKGALAQFLALVDALSAASQSSDLTLTQAAMIAGMKESSFRVIAFKKDSPLKRHMADGNRNSVRIDYESFLAWLQETRPVTHAAVTGSAIDATTATQAKVIALLTKDYGFTGHVLKDTTIMTVLVSPGGQLVAIETRGNTKLWLRPLKDTNGLEHVDSGRSEASTLDLTGAGDYGRHSGLRKYPEIRAQTLDWYRPRLMEDVRTIATRIVSADAQVGGVA